MIKRRFYRHEHADGNDVSDSSSSSSDSELEAEATEETEAEDDADDVAEVREYHESHSSSSGYESEDSSANEVDVDSSGLLTNDDIGTGNDGQNVIRSHSASKSDAEIMDTLSNTMTEEDSVPDVGWILKCKSVFKCRLCPRIVCLTEDTLKVHLKSKRHARSEKLLGEGRLKLMLNSDGEIEGEGETHAERHARIVAAAQNSDNSRKKNKGRQRQRKRLKKEKGKDSKLEKARQSTKSPAKKRHKSEK